MTPTTASRAAAAGPIPAPQTAAAGPGTDVSRYRVVVADDHPLFRQGMVRALEADGRFSVVGIGGDGAAALRLVRALVPDVALLDVRMPGRDGVEVVRALAAEGPDVPVVLLSAFNDGPLIAAALRAGAAAYVDKAEDRDAICLQLATVASSHGRFAPRRLRDPDRRR